MIVLLLASMALVPLKVVTVKMLPFDNKSELQVMVDAPEGTTLEATLAAAREMADRLVLEDEVRDIQVYAGTSAPFNFNGLVRHYFLRSGPNVADLQVNLLHKSERELSSHDMAKKVRPIVVEIAQRHGVRVKVAEIPSGPARAVDAGGRGLRPRSQDADRHRAIRSSRSSTRPRASSTATGTSRPTSPSCASSSIARRRRWPASIPSRSR